ncbi:MAG TPA: RNA pseudouridine synthase, partial [Polyangiaceae bacterium]
MTTRSRHFHIERARSAADALMEVAPDDPTAIRDGRLFVNGRRITAPELELQAGQVVTCYAARRSSATPEDTTQLLLDRRGGILAASKPTQWSSEPDRAGTTTSLRERLAQQLGVAELHVATRLDVGVSGLVLLASDEPSRIHLANAIAKGNCHRHYLGLVGARLPSRGTWRGAVEPSGQATRNARQREAVTHFECKKQMELASRGVTVSQRVPIDVVSLVVFRPETGHRHQLRIHSSRAGAPIVGDRRYGGASRFVDSNGRVSSLERI